MRKFVRIIALLAIAVFLPSTVLSAAPLVWCVAGDDHRAIEFGISDHWHGHGRHWHVSVSGDELAMPVGPDGHSHDCLDDELLGPMASNAANILLFVPATVEIPVWAALSDSHTDTAPLLAKAIRPPPKRHLNAPYPAFLSTTKLLL